jgi:PleD family two-component response regulator
MMPDGADQECYQACEIIACRYGGEEFLLIRTPAYDTEQMQI